MNYDLSILIPARNEQFLSKTVENLLENIEGNTEILVGLDGEWSDPPLPDNERLTVVYYDSPIGQRAMTNQLCKLSKAKYVMKIDAHCAVDKGFDIKLMADMEDDITMIPALYNLHAFDWKCKKCGNRWYQGPTPERCQLPGEKQGTNEKCDSKEFERVMVWEPRKSRRSEFYRFDTALHFQYHGDRKKHPGASGDLVETMSAQGSCFMLTREKYWELNICDENHGSWGQQGTEVACKTWLSGGRLLTNKKTWYAHMFRTQGGDFGFPYPLSGSEQNKARNYSKDMWFNNSFDKQIHPLSWLIEKFKPLPDWHEESGKDVLAMVNEKGKKFSRNENTKGCIYYTDNQVPMKIGHASRKSILKSNLPITSVSLKPMDFGNNIHLKLERGYRAYFTQILTALENSKSDIIFFTEHDWLYHPSHFEFTPSDKNTFYYNWNWWRVRAQDGLSVHYDTQLLPGIVAFRDTLLTWYHQVLTKFEELSKEVGDAKAALSIGFEPGTNKRFKPVGDFKVEKFWSKYPLIDIRHDGNLTASKWSTDEFRSPKNAQNWIQKDCSEIEGWNFKKGDFLGSL